MAEATDRQGLFLQNLKDAGCTEATVSKCLTLAANNEMDELLRLLSGHKKELLKAVHTKQKEIDCLDFLIYTLRKQRRT